ncbi:MAG: hypothetical protein IJU01_07570 [Lachnospiraceae bacterium]|nr:hypothetical protein [Lachnospiraceae bacterium]
MSKRLVAVLSAVLMIVSLSACSLFGHSFSPERTGIYIADDRSIQSAEITDFDNSKYSEPRYKEDELKAFIDDAVDTYNKQKSSDGSEERVTVKELSVDETTAKLILEFMSAEDYLEFNGVSEAVPIKNLVVGSVQDGIDSGLEFADMLGSDGNPATADDIKKDADYTLVLFKGVTELQCEGKIVYYSASLQKSDDYTVISTEETTSFVIFK